MKYLNSLCEKIFENKKSVSPVIATVIIVAVAIAIGIAVAFWISGLLGAIGYGTRPIKLAIYGELQGGGSLLYVRVKNLGGDQVFIDYVMLDGKYHGTITGAYNEENGEDRTITENNEKIAYLKPGETIVLLFTLELNKSEMARIFQPGVSHQITLHTTLGLEFYKELNTVYRLHGSWTLRSGAEGSIDGWVLQGGHAQWGAERGSPSYHIYVCRLDSWTLEDMEIGQTIIIELRARWIQGNDDIMIIFCYDGSGNGYAAWTGIGGYWTSTCYTSLSWFTDYGSSKGFYSGTRCYYSGGSPTCSCCCYPNGTWYIFKVKIKREEENKFIAWYSIGDCPCGQSWKPAGGYIIGDGGSTLYGFYVGIGYWEDPHTGEQAIYQFDYFKIFLEGAPSDPLYETNFDNPDKFHMEWTEEG